MQRPKSVMIAVGAVLVAAASTQAQDLKLARGKYLVERVAMCADCHSARNEKGEFIQTKWLQGARLDFAPTHPMPVWADYAPPIAGLPGLTEAQAVHFLETGTAPSGGSARPPMPPYRMSRGDAEAVAAYLKSLVKK